MELLGCCFVSLGAVLTSKWMRQRPSKSDIARWENMTARHENSCLAGFLKKFLEVKKKETKPTKQTHLSDDPSGVLLEVRSLQAVWGTRGAGCCHPSAQLVRFRVKFLQARHTGAAVMSVLESWSD